MVCQHRKTTAICCVRAWGQLGELFLAIYKLLEFKGKWFLFFDSVLSDFYFRELHLRFVNVFKHGYTIRKKTQNDEWFSLAILQEFLHVTPP